MIRQLQIENFRCLRAVTMTLEPLTVFVGANASGKSSVFSALIASRHLWQSPDDLWQRDQSLSWCVQAGTEQGETWVRGFGIRGFNKSTNTFPEPMVLQLEPQAMRSASQLEPMNRLSPNGAGMVNVFASLPRSTRDEVARHYCRLVPMFADIDARPAGSGSHRMVFQDRWRPEIWYEPHQVSDGSMLLLAFLLLPYQSPAPDIVAIEEPERGLHPYLMGQLISALRKLANGELGPRPVQVLLATHSAELLEFVEPREVRFFHRSKGSGETVVEQAPVDDPSWLKSLREYDDSLGDLWLSGGLGGVPGR